MRAIDTTATATDAGTQSTAGIYSPGTSSSSEGHKLSTGAAAGIGVGGALLLVAVLGLAVFFFRRAHKRKQRLKQPPSNFAPSSHHPSLGPTSPPPPISSPYEQPQEEAKVGYNDPPPMTLVPNYGDELNTSHELDSSALASGRQTSAYQSQAAIMTPKPLPSPRPTGIVAPQPRSPPPALTSSGFQYQQQSRGQISPPTGGQRTPGSNHESGSYGFPSQEASPSMDAEGFQFQQPQQQGASSPESQQHLFPRRMVGSPNLRSSQ